MWATKKAIVLLTAVGFLSLVPGRAFPPASNPPQHTDVSAAPGPLSFFHADKPGSKSCEACHATPGEASPEKCLACHREIADRIREGHGFHRDKAASCGTCHAEHQGPDTSLVPLDVTDFDHTETGFVLKGHHAGIKDCERCHTAGNDFPRRTGKSYLLRDSRCAACHTSPHPGRQDECLACHNLGAWK